MMPVSFNLQACTELHPGTPQKHRAALTFQFQAGYVSPANLKQITDTIAEVLAVAEQPATRFGFSRINEGRGVRRRGVVSGSLDQISSITCVLKKENNKWHSIRNSPQTQILAAHACYCWTPPAR